MNKLAACLAVGAATLFVGTADAAPLFPTTPAIDNGVENVRLVCNEWGRCWRVRGPRYGYRSYGYYAPNYGYAPDYGYGYGYRRPYYHQRPGVYFGAPGVSFGFGVGPRYW